VVDDSNCSNSESGSEAERATKCWEEPDEKQPPVSSSGASSSTAADGADAPIIAALDDKTSGEAANIGRPNNSLRYGGEDLPVKAFLVRTARSAKCHGCQTMLDKYQIRFLAEFQKPHWKKSWWMYFHLDRTCLRILSPTPSLLDGLVVDVCSLPAKSIISKEDRVEHMIGHTINDVLRRVPSI
jgi:hypothetical protein